MSSSRAIAQKWQQRLTPWFENRCYVVGKNTIKFSLSAPELRELFELGEKKMSQKYFMEKWLTPVVARMHTYFKTFTYNPINVEGKFLGIDFKVTRKGVEARRPNFRSTPWERPRFTDTTEINTCCDIEHLKYWYKDNRYFLQGILCEYDTGVKATTLHQQQAIEKRLKVLESD